MARPPARLDEARAPICLSEAFGPPDIGRSGKNDGAHCAHRSLAGLIMKRALLLFLALSTLAGCGDEAGPGLDTLTLREMLGLSPERIAELDASARAHFVEAIRDAWSVDELATFSSPLELATVPEGQADASSLNALRAFDRLRAELDLDAQPLSLVAHAEQEQVVSALDLSPEVLGLRFEKRIVITPLADDEDVYRGAITIDARWGDAELPELGGRTEAQQVERLEPLARRLFRVLELGEQSTQIVPAPQAPTVFFLSREDRALFVNPSILRLLSEAPLGLTGSRDVLVTRSFALTPDFVLTCVEDQRVRCEACFGDTFVPKGIGCETPLMPQTEQSVDGARAECAVLPTQDLALLYCTNLFIRNNLGCFMQFDSINQCGALGGPYLSVEALENLRPALDNDICDRYLELCQQSEAVDPEPVVDPPPTPPATSSDDSSNDWDWCADCTTAGCEGAGDGCASGDGGGSGGGCEGDSGGGGGCEGDGLGDGLCSEDSSDGKATASILRAGQGRSGDLALLLPGLFLLGVIIKER